MLVLSDYEFFIDKRVSKNGKDYYALFIKVDDKEELVCFINKSFYTSLTSHSQK